jgi:hypothetical protein
VRKIRRGELQELVKGSLDTTMQRVRQAFYTTQGDESGLWVVEVFAEYVIVEDSKTPDTYWLIPYTMTGDGVQFVSRDAWEQVELAYKPAQTTERAGKKNGKRFVESCGRVQICESDGDGPRRIKAVGITADVENGNRRVYPAAALESAVQKLRTHLAESAGQGRLLLGEAEHPSDKGGRPSILETVVRWTDVQFSGGQVLLEGIVIQTSKGKDISTLMESGVLPGVSQRAYGKAKTEQRNGHAVEVITELEITGYDLVLEPSDPNGAVVKFESLDKEFSMSWEELVEMLKKNPGILQGVVAEEVARLNEGQRADFEKSMRAKLGIGADGDLGIALQEAIDAKKQLSAQRVQADVDAEIVRLTEGLKYSPKMNEQFVAAVKAAKPASVEAARALVEAKRGEYDALAASMQLRNMGWGSKAGASGTGSSGGTDFEAVNALNESLRKIGSNPAVRAESGSARFAEAYLEAFDKKYARQLADESRQFTEAESTSDLNLPYSVLRAVLAVALPKLVASEVFDFGVMDAATSRLFYETYSGESGATGTVTDEAVTADLNAYVALANKRLTPGTVVVTNSGATATYVEGTDYLIDYANGQLKAIATITDGQALKVDYEYSAIRKGEGGTIERGKMSLSYVVLDPQADRLAAQITREAIVFSKASMGWDAVGRTLNALVKEIAAKIDQGAFYLALASVLGVSSNSGGTWDRSSDTLDELAAYIGIAKVKVENRYYSPTSIVMSKTNSDKLSDWTGFTAAGKFPGADLNANGYVGRLKGLPVFDSTEMSDDYILVVDRDLVAHRVAVPMTLRGPFPVYSSGKLVSSEEWYAEEFNATMCPVPEKGAYVKLQD